MSSEKIGAIHLTALLKERGVKNIVICPGSRNAPLIISFTSDPYFTCFSMVDERSAAFFALGLSQSSKHTTAIVCTSGSALLNIGPAVAEAFYQRLPLLVISADRPLEWVNQGESQTMDQSDVFKNYCRASFDLVQEATEKDDLWYNDRQISEAINKTMNPYFGPVHLNIRFKEPLYGQGKYQAELRSNLKAIPVRQTLADSDLDALKKIWNAKQRIMIVCGQFFPDGKLLQVLDDLAKKGVVVLTESTSNMPGANFFPSIDKIVIPTNEAEKAQLSPDLLISIGGALVSRKIKNYLRPKKALIHWHVDPIDEYNDAYQHQSLAIKMFANEFLPYFLDEEGKDMAFFNFWDAFKKHAEARHVDYISKAPFSDLKAFDMILDHLPDKCQLQVGNSASIRYLQLISKRKYGTCFSNRGTSGIEGSISTALGASVQFDGLTIAIAGDLSLMYDSNALWNNYLHPNFKLIVINNGGGGIFRIIEGPTSVPSFEKFIETKHDRDFKKLAELYGLTYFEIMNEAGFQPVWKDFIAENNRPAMLEINTKESDNDKVLLNYFDHLKTDL